MDSVGFVYVVDTEEVVIEPEPEKDGVYTLRVNCH